jgi:competence protein ComEA
MDAEKVYQENTSTLNVSITNINTANKNELMSLPNIGTVKVEEIIRFREEYGKFMTVDDLLKVSGIGPKTLEKLKPFVTI